jgi:ABC-type Fe3+/spermidine/putrescine transport system ATPase subunit
MTSPGFELRGVAFHYDGIPVLEELTLQLAPGTRTAIVGPSAAGKSTLLRLLAGLDAPTRGEILLDGAVVSLAQHVLVPPHLRTVSMVFQDLALWPNLSALGNVELALTATGLSSGARLRRASAVLDLVGIGPLANRLPYTLSGGEQQRVALARSLAPSPRYLFLDEPFASIDLPAKARLLAEIAQLADQEKIGVILVTHDPFEAVALCDDVAVLERGRLIERDCWRSLLAAEVPSSETLRAFRAQLGTLQQLGRPASA